MTLCEFGRGAQFQKWHHRRTIFGRSSIGADAQKNNRYVAEDAGTDRQIDEGWQAHGNGREILPNVTSRPNKLRTHMDRIAIDFEERAAIREYDGNQTRAEAEKAALEEVNAAWKEYAEKQKGSNNATS